ncbi:MAG: sialate O-acetylesterase [Victivallales bacterium]|nr:sialate O-acetylesterase [Victivallales bacterium]
MNIHSFVMMGQSNMAGRGDFGEVPPINHPRCRMLRNGRWQPMAEPINPDRPIFDTLYHSGVCLTASFAESYANAYTDVQCGLIPCADGGTSMDDWAPGGLLYDHAVFQTKLAQRTSTVHGILWHQGEQDCCSAENLRSYRTKFEIFLAQFIEDTELPDDIPIIVGELGYFASPMVDFDGERINATAYMNALFRTIADETPNIALASAEGLDPKPDGIHFNSASLREFGRRYFDAYQSLIK